MEHQLYVLQCLMFSQLNIRKNTAATHSDQVLKVEKGMDVGEGGPAEGACSMAVPIIGRNTLDSYP